MNEISRMDTGDQQVSAASAQPGSMLAVISAAATNPAVDVAKMQALLEMQFKLEERQAVQTFNQALGRVNRQMPRVKKNGTIELGSGKGSIPFARYEDMDTLIRPILNQEGFTISFSSEERAGGGVTLTAKLLHPAGHFSTATVPLPLDTGPGRNNIQAMGSTLSYGRRYAVEMLLNIVREGADDDGKAAGIRYITEADALKVEALLTETKSDRTAFMRHFEVDSILEITVENGAAALNMLNSKKAKMGGKS